MRKFSENADLLELVKEPGSVSIVNAKQRSHAAWQLCVAPMIDVTDRHCRYFHRLLAPHARVYTEMMTTGALLHGDVARHLAFNPAEHPIALQLGGSDPHALAQAARLGQQWGYDEINLNCGCPSQRVQQGEFGACLMASPERVAAGIQAMRDAVDIPVTVKHRLGLNHDDDYAFVRDFVGKLFDAGCRVFIVHARNAILTGLSPKHNREIPPLRYDKVIQLKHDFPHCTIVLNGGIQDVETAVNACKTLDGIMVGRAAWHNPRVLAEISSRFWSTSPCSEAAVIEKMVQYATCEVAKGVPLRIIVRPLLGLMNGQTGARRWRRMLSDQAALAADDPQLIYRAWCPSLS